MATIATIAAFTDHLLSSPAISDAAVNGIQIRGREEVQRLVTGVSACMELFQAAAACQAELVLVHHGLLWAKDTRIVAGNFKRRLGYLLEHDLTLMAYHLPLDCHPSLGNNRLILDRLGWRIGAGFGHYHGTTLSSLGYPSEPLAATTIVTQIKDCFGGDPLWLPFGPEQIRCVAVCSGAAPELIREAKEAGADLFLTGESAESVYHYAKEESIHFVAAGHHRTERFGIQALGERLAREFAIEHHFIDIANPL